MAGRVVLGKNTSQNTSTNSQENIKPKESTSVFKKPALPSHHSSHHTSSSSFIVRPTLASAAREQANKAHFTSTSQGTKSKGYSPKKVNTSHTLHLPSHSNAKPPAKSMLNHSSSQENKLNVKSGQSGQNAQNKENQVTLLPPKGSNSSTNPLKTSTNEVLVKKESVNSVM